MKFDWAARGKRVTHSTGVAMVTKSRPANIDTCMFACVEGAQCVHMRMHTQALIPVGRSFA